jgi:hypothetical protein
MIDAYGSIIAMGVGIRARVEMEAEPPSDYHRHEALDRASLLCDMIGNYLLDHQFIQADEGLRADVERALGILADVYQRIGAQHLGGVKPPVPA